MLPFQQRRDNLSFFFFFFLVVCCLLLLLSSLLLGGKQIRGGGGVTRFLVLTVKNPRSEAAQNTTILCPAVCINDFLNKAGRCGKRLKYVTSNPFFFFFFFFFFFPSSSALRC